MKSWCSFHRKRVQERNEKYTFVGSEPQGDVGRSPLIYLKFSLICCPPRIERKGQEILPRPFTSSLEVPTETLPGTPSRRELRAPTVLPSGNPPVSLSSHLPGVVTFPCWAWSKVGEGCFIFFNLKKSIGVDSNPSRPKAQQFCT